MQRCKVEFHFMFCVNIARRLKEALVCGSLGFNGAHFKRNPARRLFLLPRGLVVLPNCHFLTCNIKLYHTLAEMEDVIMFP